MPASLMVFNDGQAFMAPEGDLRAQNVMDNLIFRREIPVMIGVFINPGRRPDQPDPHPRDWGDRSTNRPVEYNTLNDSYARVIAGELLPVLHKEYNISKDPNHHGIEGASSGGDCRVHGGLGSSGSLSKGAQHCGNFHQPAGRTRLSRDHQEESEKAAWESFCRTAGMTIGRSGRMEATMRKQGGAIMPETMRWLWRDHPASTDVRNSVERSFYEPAEKAGEKK